MMTPSQPAPEQIQTGLSVGDSLRLRREQLGWSLLDIADWLRIRLAYLQALEEGRPQDLPGSTYALGFLRSYGSTLGLDPQDLSRRFRQETGGLERRQTLSFPAPAPERGVPAGAALLIGVVLLGGAYAGWYMFGGHENLPVQSVPPLPASLAPYAVEPPRPTALPPQAAAASPPPAAAPVPSSRVVPPPAAAAAAPQRQATATAGSDAPAAPAPAAVAAAVAPAPPPTPAPITVKASASSWVQVRQAGGPVIYERILQAGESWPVPSGSGALLLSTGNAGGITVSAGEVTTPVLGPSGAVRRNLPLSAEAIRDGSLLARPASQQPTLQ